MSQLKVSRQADGEPEIFASVQGEGVTLGVASAFVRFAICNLRCVWCDTKYTWDWKAFDPKAEIVRLDVLEVAERVRTLALTNVVITGGEPLLQADGLEALAALLKGWGHRVEVETNATMRPTREAASYVDQWNVSPKLANAGNTSTIAQRPAVIDWFAAQPNAFFKFVVVKPDDIGEILRLACQHAIPTQRILLSPEGRESEILLERSRWLVELCKRYDLRFSPRLHVLVWGDERGR